METQPQATVAVTADAVPERSTSAPPMMELASTSLFAFEAEHASVFSGPRCVAARAAAACILRRHGCISSCILMPPPPPRRAGRPCINSFT